MSTLAGWRGSAARVSGKGKHWTLAGWVRKEGSEGERGVMGVDMRNGNLMDRAVRGKFKRHRRLLD